jgi:hypothetical protein
MALKYVECNWDFEKGLMFVVFQKGQQQYRWYPKWIELDELMRDAYSTEVGNKGKLVPFFGLTALEILLELVFGNNEFAHNETIYRAFHEVKKALLKQGKAVNKNG